MTRKLIYLSGPIAAATYDGATDWYIEAKLRLHLRGDYETIRPMRGKAFLAGKVTGLIGMDGYETDTAYQAALVSPRGIYMRDRHDVARCDAVLMNVLGATVNSLGCAVEAGWADLLGKPVVLVAEPTNPHRRHPIVGSIPAYIVDNVIDAVDLIHGIFGG